VSAGCCDSLIIASALENDCEQLYPEDLQHEQIIQKKIKIINPFL
jgi:predicted nucleic acid-binding protein